ncbi:MAG: hypothetical protein LBC41_13890, partial [Clostridiales bacterium]|nr:hypothetical protein [Clostridiales bacterium]
MPHIKAKATKALAFFLALAILAGAIPAVTAYAATPTLRVKMDAASRPLYHGATGWLYGQGADNVPTSNVIAPLKPNTAVQKPPSGMQHPDGDVLDIAGTFLDSGGKWLQIYVPDWYALWYYEFTGTDAYMDILLYEAQAVIDAGYADKAVWVLYNEPSSNWITNVQPGGYEGETGWNSMFHFWEDMVDALRELYADNGLSYRPLTCGLNLAGWDTGVMSSFLQYCVTNDCYPDIISWHELSTGQFNSFPSHYASYRSLESQYLQGNAAGVDPTPREIVINEYADRAECSSPGNLARWIGLWEDYEVGGCLPFWHFSNNLNGLAADSNEGNGAWWLYKWYGDMSGSYKPVTASGASKQDFYGAASYDENKKLATAIFGGQSGDGEIIFENITGVDAYSGTSQVHVKIEATDWTGFHGAAPEPRVVAEGAIEVTSGSVTVPVTGMLAKSGYRVTVTPSDPSEKLGLLHSGWKGHFEAEAGTLGGNAKLQTNSSAYAVSGGSSNNRVGYVDLASDSVTNSISVPYSGWYRYDLVYSAATGVNTGDPASSNPLNAIMHLYLDGASDPVLDLLLESTELWDMFGMHTEYLYLEAGAHLLKLTGNGSSAAGQGQGVPDCFYLTYEGAELADTYFDMDYEAEMGEFNAIKSATTLSTIFEGGTGYVSGLELKSVPDGGGLRFTAVVPGNGMYKATLRYKSSASAAAKIYVGNDMANLTNLVAELGLPQAADPSEAGMLI